MSAATTTTAAAVAPYRQAPSTFRPKPILNLSFSSTLRHPKLSFKLTGKNHGAIGAKMADSAASSYAAALAEVAVANGTLEATVKDLDLVETLFSDKTNLDYFVSPIINIQDKYALIDDITSSGKLQLHVCNFLNVLIERKRIDMIKEIIKEFDIVYNKLTETELAVVSSVVKLEEQHLAQLAKQVQKLTGAKNVRVKTVIDESLVAGFTIRYGSSGSKLIDMSVKKQLEEIASELEIGDISLAV